MAWLKRIGSWILPRRASTQTWMFLTFSLFVGMAVVVVGLYVAFVLRGQIRTGTRQALVQQAERAASLFERAASDDDRLNVIRDITRLTDLRVTIVADSLVWTTEGARPVAEDTLLTASLMQVGPGRRIHFSEQLVRDRRNLLFVSLYRPFSGIVIRIGQPEPILFALIERMQATLLVGMVMALLLALIGSWVASAQVTRSLKSIRNSARSISEGEFHEKIGVESRAAEFHDLARSLNRMSEAFKAQIEEHERMAQIQNEFIGNVSHEVRNPIFAISGYLEALGSPSLTPEMRTRYSEKGLNNLERLQNLFNDLIEIARLEYREDLIRASVFDLEELVEEVSEMLRPKAVAKGINLEVENPHLNVEADRSRLRQVLINLIDNAIAYSDSGTVRCRFRRRLGKVRIEVVDSGKGIGEDHLDRIFERFYRVDPDRSRKSGGTGLGLSIVKQILQAHGEVIHVESTMGRGTRFWFELPYAGKAEPVEAEPVEAGPEHI